MTEEDLVQEWARELAEAIANTIEFKAQAFLDCQQLAPEENEWGVDLVELWPALMEIQEAGPNDGELVFGIVDRFDLLAAEKVFDEVENVIFGFDNDGEPQITIEGMFKGRLVAVIVYFEPWFDEDNEEDVE
jgi:hypothetical protein